MSSDDYMVFTSVQKKWGYVMKTVVIDVKIFSGWFDISAATVNVAVICVFCLEVLFNICKLLYLFLTNFTYLELTSSDVDFQVL